MSKGENLIKVILFCKVCISARLVFRQKRNERIEVNFTFSLLTLFNVGLYLMLTFHLLNITTCVHLIN